MKKNLLLVTFAILTISYSSFLDARTYIDVGLSFGGCYHHPCYDECVVYRRPAYYAPPAIVIPQDSVVVYPNPCYEEVVVHPYSHYYPPRVYPGTRGHIGVSHRIR